jgi:hypothetical protein
MELDSGPVRYGQVIKTMISAAGDARLVINHALMEMVKEKGLVAKEGNS